MDEIPGRVDTHRGRPAERRAARWWSIGFAAFLTAWIGAFVYLGRNFEPEGDPDGPVGWALLFVIVGAIPLMVVFALWVRALLRLQASVQADPRLDRSR